MSTFEKVAKFGPFTLECGYDGEGADQVAFAAIYGDALEDIEHWTIDGCPNIETLRYIARDKARRWLEAVSEELRRGQ